MADGHVIRVPPGLPFSVPRAGARGHTLPSEGTQTRPDTALSGTLTGGHGQLGSDFRIFLKAAGGVVVGRVRRAGRTDVGSSSHHAQPPSEMNSE